MATFTKNHEFVRTVDFSTGNCSIQLRYCFLLLFRLATLTTSKMRPQQRLSQCRFSTRASTYLIHSGKWQLKMLLISCCLVFAFRLGRILYRCLLFTLLKVNHERSKQIDTNLPKILPMITERF